METIQAKLFFPTPIPLSPIFNSNFFPPSNADTAFTLCRGRCLVHFSDLYSEGSFVTFNDCRVQYNLPQSHLFRYLQAWNYARTHFKSFPQSPTGSLITEVLSLFQWLVVRFQYYLTSYLRICSPL